MSKLSIVTICYNNCEELERTIWSVIRQDFHDYEFIIIDGGSSDRSVEVIKKYEKHIDYWLSEPDKGIYNAMNKGLSHANGEWIFFLNSGDMFASEHAISDVDFAKADMRIGAIYGRYQYYNRYDDLLLNEVEHPFFNSNRKYRGMGFSHQSVFVRTELAKHFRFDESYKLCADYNMMMKIYQAGYQFKRTEAIIALCDGRGGASAKNRFIQDKETARVCGCEYTFRPFIHRNLKRIARPLYHFIMHIKKEIEKK